jgi:hypothetical protein
MATQSKTSSTQSKTSSTLPVGAWLSIVAGVLIAAGVFLPWTSVTFGGLGAPQNAFQLGAFNESFRIDGVIALALGVVAVVIGIAGLMNSGLSRFIQRSPIIVGIGAGVLVATRLSALNVLVNGLNPALKGFGLGHASIAAGFYMVAVGAGLAVIAGLILRSRPSQSQA